MTAINGSAIAATLDSLKPFPRVVLDVLNILDDENANLNLLVNHVKRDPVLTSRLLSMANTAFMHLNGQREVTDLFAALSMMGLAKVQNLVTTYELEKAYGRPPSAMEGTEFWGHSLDVATAGKVLAEHYGLHPEYVFVGGLLHDIGQVWIATQHPMEYLQFQFKLIGSTRPQLELEQEIFGMDHAQVGMELARLWGLPHAIVQAVAGHHDPDQANGDRIAHVVHMAEIIANGLSLSERGCNRVDAVSSHALELLSIQMSEMSDLFGEIQARSRHLRVMSGLRPH